MGALTFILGGARSGKSTYAEERALAHGGSVLYVATAEALDPEMENRIRKHQDDRPHGWQTLEVPIELAATLQEKGIQTDVVLLDCLTLLVSNIATRFTEDLEAPPESLLFEKSKGEIQALLSLIATSQADWFVVSNELGMGLVPPYPLGRIYRDILGVVNKMVARDADEVILMVAGLPMKLEKK